MNDNTTPQPAPGLSAPATDRELRRLRRLIREQLADAVTEERLDIDHANGIPDAIGLPNLTRVWKVRVALPFVCEVTAASDAAAFDAAENAIEAALAHAGIPVDIDWEGRERDEALPGDIDHHGRLTDDTDEAQSRTAEPPSPRSPVAPSLAGSPAR